MRWLAVCIAAIGLLLAAYGGWMHVRFSNLVATGVPGASAPMAHPDALIEKMAQWYASSGGVVDPAALSQRIQYTVWAIIAVGIILLVGGVIALALAKPRRGDT